MTKRLKKQEKAPGVYVAVGFETDFQGDEYFTDDSRQVKLHEAVQLKRRSSFAVEGETDVAVVEVND